MALQADGIPGVVLHQEMAVVKGAVRTVAGSADQFTAAAYHHLGSG
jgi:hypothetical protein